MGGGECPLKVRFFVMFKERLFPLERSATFKPSDVLIVPTGYVKSIPTPTINNSTSIIYRSKD